MAQLYQMIMNVPGLTGTWQERNKQLYYKLGAPMGSYTGNLQQNLYLLDQINKNNYFKSGLPGSTSTKTTTTTDPRAAIADATLSKVQTSKPFTEVMPQEIWNSVFDEWTRNFANEYILPEWQENTYKPQLEEMARTLESLNNQIGLSGAWRSGTAQDSLVRASEDSLKQEESLRQQYQDSLAALREDIQNTWASPLYTSQMERYSNAPWRDLNLGDITNQAGIDASTTLNSLATQYGVTDTSKLSSLLGNLGNWDPTAQTSQTIYDWSVPKGDLSLLNQYKLSS